MIYNKIKAGQQFMITDHYSCNRFKPGTTGYILNISNNRVSSSPAIFCEVIILRVGKGGKLRFNLNNVLTTPFLVDPLKEILNDSVFMLTKDVYGDVTTMPNLEFLAWFFAKTLYYNEYFRPEKIIDNYNKSAYKLMRNFLDQIVEEGEEDLDFDTLTDTGFRLKLLFELSKYEALIAKTYYAASEYSRAQSVLECVKVLHNHPKFSEDTARRKRFASLYNCLGKVKPRKYKESETEEKLFQESKDVLLQLRDDYHWV